MDMKSFAVLRSSLLAFSLLSFTPLSSFAAAPPPNDCPSCGLSKASADLSVAASTVVEGSLMVVGASGVLVVESVAAVGESVVVVFKGVSEAASVTVRLSGEGVRQLGLISGAIVQATAVSTGHILISAGKVIAFIPNEIGKALVYHARVQ